MHMILAKSIRFIFLSSRNMIDVCFRRKTNQFMKLLLIMSRYSKHDGMFKKDMYCALQRIEWNPQSNLLQAQRNEYFFLLIS